MSDKKKIFIIEDEEDLVLSLEDRLTSEGYHVSSCAEGIAAEKQAREDRSIDLILLDVMLPGKDGFQICRELREAGCRVPVLMLTARNTTIDTVMGLRIGADDYLAKPFEMQVLLARIAALLRRADYKPASEHEQIISFGEFVLNTSLQELHRGQKPVPLNAQEYRLLKFLANHPGRVLDRQKLLDEVWGYDSVLTTRTVDVHVAWLRQKLDEQEIPRHIRTVRGYGYKFMLA